MWDVVNVDLGVKVGPELGRGLEWNVRVDLGDADLVRCLLGGLGVLNLLGDLDRLERLPRLCGSACH